MGKLKKFFKRRFRRKGKAKRPKANLKSEENNPVTTRKEAKEDKTMREQMTLQEESAEDKFVRTFMQERVAIMPEIEANEGGRTGSRSEFVPDFYPDTHCGEVRADEAGKQSRLYQPDGLLKNITPLKPETTMEYQGVIKADVEDYFESKGPQNLQAFLNISEDGGKCDVQICIDNDVFLANKQALSRYSSYFSNAFQKETGKEEQSVYKIIGLSSGAFSVFLEFIYSGKFSANRNNLADVIRMVDQLSILDLKERCLEKAIQNLLGKQYSQGSWMYGFMVSYLANEFPRACLIEGFFELDFSTICGILSNDYLQTPSEVLVFKVALAWINHCIPERNHYLEKIMSCVRIKHMAQKEAMEFFELIDEHSELMQTECYEARENIKFANWILIAKTIGVDGDIPLTQVRKSLAEKQELERKCSIRLEKTSSVSLSALSEPEVSDNVESTSSQESSDIGQETDPYQTCGDIVVVGGYKQCQNYSENELSFVCQSSVRSYSLLLLHLLNVKLVQSYAPLENRWSHCTKLPEPRFHHAVAMLNGMMYLTGGFDPKRGDDLPTSFNNASKDVFVFNFEIRKWKQIAPMNTARAHHTVCSLGGKLYVIGGKDDKSSVLRSVECFNPEVNEWVFVQSMLLPRLGASAAVQDGKIVVVGGYGVKYHQKHVPVLRAVETYDPALDSWETNNSLRLPRCHSNLVNVNGNLYLCGGATYTLHDGNRVLTSVTSIDVYNKNKDIWEEKANLRVARHHAGCVVLGGRIYIIGGESTKLSKILRSVECYDVINDVWDNDKVELRYPARCLSCVTLPANL